MFSISPPVLFTFKHIHDIFLLFSRLEKIRDFSLPTQVFSASLHPKRQYIVAGGDDFKLYKYDFDTLTELGKEVNYISIGCHLQFNMKLPSQIFLQYSVGPLPIAWLGFQRTVLCKYCSKNSTFLVMALSTR